MSSSLTVAQLLQNAKDSYRAYTPEWYSDKSGTSTFNAEGDAARCNGVMTFDKNMKVVDLMLTYEPKGQASNGT